jgi:hypothetical protein
MKKLNNANTNAMEMFNASIVNSRRNDVKANLLNAELDLNQLMQLKDINEEMKQSNAPIQVLQKIYNPESLVGAVTNVVGNFCNVNVRTEKGFNLFKDKLAKLNNEGIHVPYGDSIWVEGVNVFSGFHFSTGKFYCYHIVTNDEMEAIADKIAHMRKDSMTVEDALALQHDLTPLLRAWQESSIDCTKDKSKKFNYNFKDFFKAINVVSTFCKKHSDQIVMNTKEAFKDSSKDFRITLPSDNNDEVAEDLVGRVTEEIRTAAETFFNGSMKELHNLADMKAYDKFRGYAKQNAELAFFIRDIYNLCYNSLNDKEAVLVKEDYAAMRNAIYTKANTLEIAPEDVINIAIDTAMVSISETNEGWVVGDSFVENFKAYPVKNIFANEYVYALTNKNNTIVIATEDNIAEIYRDIEDDEEFNFVNGKAVDEDGETILVIDNDYTGRAYEEDGVIIASIYEYQEVKAMVVYKTCDENSVGNKLVYDKAGKYFNELVKASNYEGIRVIGKNCNGIRNNERMIGIFRGTVAFNKGETFDDIKVLSFEPSNGNQRIFFVTVK